MEIIIVLDNIRSAYNVGAIFRTADGVGASVHLIGMTPKPTIDKKLLKTALGATNSVDWKYFTNITEWMNYTLNDTDLILAIEEGNFDNKVDLFNINKVIKGNMDSKIYLVFGHEINGVGDEFINNSNFIVEIPMFGSKNSLNVSTSVGIVSYYIKGVLLRSK